MSPAPDPPPAPSSSSPSLFPLCLSLFNPHIAHTLCLSRHMISLGPPPTCVLPPCRRPAHEILARAAQEQDAVDAAGEIAPDDPSVSVTGSSALG
jgi:hypothetical protein